ncbi:hypothetical protein KCP78_18825 [Salmonella enterica subsp. enterica]|nr:hypothetical protein KCP78_18825 [Salmonella enterica subsp. enterica]
MNLPGPLAAQLDLVNPLIRRRRSSASIATWRRAHYNYFLTRFMHSISFLTSAPLLPRSVSHSPIKCVVHFITLLTLPSQKTES